MQRQDVYKRQAMGIIEDINLDTISWLLISAQAGMITAKEGHSLDAAQRDIKRASLVRNTIKSQVLYAAVNSIV